MMLWRKSFKYAFSKIKRSQILGSNYDGIVDKIVSQYGQKQLQIPSALSLMQIHHLYNILRPGDWVLDIGAGPYFSWTNIALKLTKNSQKTNLVISNDYSVNPIKKQKNIHIQGDFFSQPVRSKIAMNLLQRPLDTILIDATPQFSGNNDIDGIYMMRCFYESLLFSENYLRKGGTIVFRTIQCPQSDINQDKSKLIFNEVYKHKPSNIPANFYSYFYVCKGYKMSPYHDEVRKFFKEYRQAISRRKPQIVKKYEGRNWDAINLVNNEAKLKIQQMKQKGHKNSQILRMYEKQKYIKVEQIIKNLDILNDEKAHPAAKIKAKQILKYGKVVTNPKLLPQNQVQFKQSLLYFAQKAKKQLDQAQNHSNKLNHQEKKPLEDNQVYMKEIKTQKSQFDQRQYIQEDLLGYKPPQSHQKQNQQLNQEQLAKLVDSIPALQGYYNPQNKEQRDQFMETFRTAQKQYKPRGQSVEDTKNRQKPQYDAQQAQVLKMFYREKKKQQKQQMRLSFTQQRQRQDAYYQGEKNMQQNLKKEYMDSKPSKVDRYVNQRRSKRKGDKRYPKF